ncbi:unnamed protein product [Pleuronectes platessa]|uniref:Uncharacterized protein n=1 Tax=Pleuronectes platessa TaxID=8262 RepID=A0A9N7TZE0_PLEPL|nr:unnamed protein product [Pleuronectes platessa]
MSLESLKQTEVLKVLSSLPAFPYLASRCVGGALKSTQEQSKAAPETRSRGVMRSEQLGVSDATKHPERAETGGKPVRSKTVRATAVGNITSVTLDKRLAEHWKHHHHHVWEQTDPSVASPGSGESHRHGKERVGMFTSDSRDDLSTETGMMVPQANPSTSELCVMSRCVDMGLRPVGAGGSALTPAKVRCGFSEPWRGTGCVREDTCVKDSM